MPGYDDHYTNRADGRFTDDASNPVKGDHVKSLYDALGPTPVGGFVTVDARLADLEARLAAIEGGSGGGGGGDPTPGSGTLVGIMGLTESQYTYMWARVEAAEEPWTSMFNYMAGSSAKSIEIPASTGIAYRAATAYSSTTYTPRAVTTVKAMTNGVDATNGPLGCYQLHADAIAARVQALLYCHSVEVLGVPNTTYRDNCIAILNAWATTCTNVEGKDLTTAQQGSEDQRLYVSWAVPHFAQAADLALCKFGGEWLASEADAFGDWMQNVLLERCDWSAFGNWQSGFSECWMHVAAFKRDDSLMTYAVNRFEDHVRTAIHMPGDTYAQKKMRDAFMPPWPWAGGYGPPGVSVPSSFDAVPGTYEYAGSATQDTWAGVASSWDITSTTEADAVWSTEGLAGDIKKDNGHRMASLGSLAAAAETAWHYGRTELWTNHGDRIAKAFELYCSYWREVIKDMVDNGRASAWYATTGNTFTPAGNYSLVDGSYDATPPATGHAAWPHATKWTNGGAWADECLFVAYAALSQRLGKHMPNLDAIVEGWTQSSVDYGDLTGSPGANSPGPRGPQNNRWLESLTAFYVNTSVAAVPPTAAFTVTQAGLTVTVDATSSTLGTGSSFTAYDWDWGDGTDTNGTDPTVSHTYTTAGPFTITLSVTDDDTQTDTEAAAVALVHAYDAFGRTDTVDTGRTLGAATIGGSWTAYPTSGTTQAGVNGNEAVIYLPDASNPQQTQYLTSVSATDVEIVAKLNVVDMPTTGDMRITLFSRYLRSGGTLTQAMGHQWRFDFDTAGRVDSVWYDGTTSEGNATVAAWTQPGDGIQFWLKAKFVGSTGYAKFWLASNSEPASWQSTRTMTSPPLTAGGVGILCETQGTYNAFPAQIEIDEFWVQAAT